MEVQSVDPHLQALWYSYLIILSFNHIVLTWPDESNYRRGNTPEFKWTASNIFYAVQAPLKLPLSTPGVWGLFFSFFLSFFSWTQLIGETPKQASRISAIKDERRCLKASTQCNTVSHLSASLHERAFCFRGFLKHNGHTVEGGSNKKISYLYTGLFAQPSDNFGFVVV